MYENIYPYVYPVKSDIYSKSKKIPKANKLTYGANMCEHSSKNV